VAVYYIAVVTLAVGAHFAFLIYVASGGFLALRWRRTIWLHVPAVLWGNRRGRVAFPLPADMAGEFGARGN
jgi:uncharacterized protein DUF2784